MPVTIAIHFIKKMLMKLVKKKSFWIAMALMPIIFIIMTNAIYFFVFKMLVAKAEEKATDTLADTEEILGIYTEDFLEDSFLEAPILGEEPSITIPMPPTEDPDYSDTLSEAGKIEGTSVLHELHNAIVERVGLTATTGITYAYILGTNYTESSAGPTKWLPFIAVPLEEIVKPGFTLRKSSYVESIWYSKNRGFKLNSTGKSYIGPFQVNYEDWTTTQGRPEHHWTVDNWERFVSNSPSSMDGSGNGIADVFNYYDSLLAMTKHAAGKKSQMGDLYIKPGDGQEDMMTMFYAAKYVGINGREGSLNGSSPGYHPLSKYQFVEGYNPHIDLMRQAYIEYKTNGPHYLRMKAAMEDMSLPNTNSASLNTIIDDFYLANGWKESNGGFTKAYPDGSGYIFIKGGNGQDIRYSFKVYWGGKIGEENIRKVLGET